MIKISSRILIFVMLLFLMACNEAETINQSVNQNAHSSNSKVISEKIKTVKLKLNASDLNKQEFLGLIIPKVKPAPPCPFLSDESALKIVKRSAGIKRRETSNESCYWSKNLGFSIKLTVEDLASAKPIKERNYNLDNPPVLKSQLEPEGNAVVLYDTAWDKELAYAIAFEQRNKLVMINVIGMTTDANRLTVAAKEVATKLSTAPIIKSELATKVEFNMCSVWQESEIEAIIGTPIRLKGSSDNCIWETGVDENLKQIKVGIYYGKNYPWESVISDGAEEISGIGERSVLIKQRKKRTVLGSALINTLYTERLVGISVTDTIENYKAVAVALSKNINNRFN